MGVMLLATSPFFVKNGPWIGTDVFEQGKVTGLVDAQAILTAYRALCDAQRLSHAGVIVMGEPD